MAWKCRLPYLSVAAVLLFCALCLAVFLWVSAAPFVCVSGGLGDNFQKTITVVDGTVDLGVKFSTTLVGLGAALLLGLKSGLTLTRGTRILLLLSITLFLQSALYGIWWRFGIADAWLNTCLNLLTEQPMQRRYMMHFLFFVFGLGSLGILAIFAAFARPSEASTSGGNQ